MNNKDRFLKAALRLFAKKGYAATSTRDICKEVGLTRSAVYNHFPSKEAILLAIEEREMLKMQAGLDAILTANADASPRDKLLSGLYYTLTVAIREQKAWRIMTEMLRSLTPKNRTAVIMRRDHYEKSVQKLLEDYANADGNFPRDLKLTTRYFFGICEGISGWYRPEDALTSEELAQDATNFFIKSLDTQIKEVKS